MKLFVFALCVACALGSSILKWEEDWFAWKAKFGKNYIEEEEDNRRQIWERNLRYIAKHNYEHDLGKHTFTVGMNQYGDLTSQEFGALYLSRMSKVSANMCKKSSSEDKLVFLPSSVDWRKSGYVTPIKNQGQCGSCWAFSTTGSIEGQHFKSTGELVSLSEQNLMDCSKPEGDFSCEGGLMDYAFDYVITNGGIDTEASYPYEASDEKTCNFTKENIGATISSCTDLPSGDEKALQKAVAEVGPISVAIDASHASFQLYRDGVYYEPDCSSTMLDHGVLAIGYGTQGSQDYWLVKNSWGTTWGDQGYLKMSRNRDNNCGIATSASYPVV